MENTMMYINKFAAAIRANGNILREFKDTVYLPFGSEYQVRLKNLNTVRALVNVYIDGDNIVPGGLVLSAGQEIDLERAIRNGNLTEGNKLKFIERTSKIEDHRGIKLEDGLVRVEVQYEKIYKRQDGIQWEYVDKLNVLYKQHDSGITWSVNPSPLRTASSCSSAAYNSASLNNITVGAPIIVGSASTAPQTETGITVPGSKSEQKFTSVSNFVCEPEKHNIILRLLGETADNKEVREPLTVKTKQKCITCGKQNKATSRYCTDCGTALEIFA